MPLIIVNAVTVVSLWNANALSDEEHLVTCTHGAIYITTDDGQEPGDGTFLKAGQSMTISAKVTPRCIAGDTLMPCKVNFERVR